MWIPWEGNSISSNSSWQSIWWSRKRLESARTLHEYQTHSKSWFNCQGKFLSHAWTCVILKHHRPTNDKIHSKRLKEEERIEFTWKLKINDTESLFTKNVHQLTVFVRQKSAGTRNINGYTRKVIGVPVNLLPPITRSSLLCSSHFSVSLKFKLQSGSRDSQPVSTYTG